MYKEPDFMVGDVVEVRKTGSQWDYKRGYVQEVSGFDIVVRIGGTTTVFDLCELIFIKSPDRLRNPWVK